ncbi:MAG TPA: class I SAM-dependent methyltransferase [Blastocatellia bacterium]|nr:class I SAM-dependent methyltransferase [Blastocatellia bacterium]
MSFRRVICFLVLSLLYCAACARDDAQLHRQPARAALESSALPAQDNQPARAPDVPYVPTPHEVVAEMLKMANVTKNDVVYDLGCGDGRIVIAAARDYGARGVGIDINPERISEAEENAKKAGVTDRVTFKTQDLFETDLSEATVVTLYLLPAVNLKLRPKLLQELKPGARVVSHSFDMGDWKPDQKAQVNGRTIYFWVIPQNKPKPH